MVEFSINGAFSADPRRPSIADFGMMPAGGLLGLYTFDSAETKLLDSSGNGAHATVDRDALNVGYEQNCLKLNAGTPFGRLVLPINRAAPGRDPKHFTHICVFRSARDALGYLIHDPDGAGISMYRASTRTGYRYVTPQNAADNITGEGAEPAGKSYDQFIMYGMAADGDRIYPVSDGKAWGAGQAISPNGVFQPNPASPIYTGDMYMQTDGLMGMLAIFDRKLSDIQLRGIYAYARQLMAGKGHSL